MASISGNSCTRLMRDMRLWTFCAFVMLLPRSIQCQSEGDLRLVDGGQSSRGRVEIFQNSTWGTICGDTWLYRIPNFGFYRGTIAHVVCRQLGLDTTHVRGYTTTLSGDGPIHTRDVHCLGSEYRIDACPIFDYGHQCNGTEVAAVECGTIEGDVRLVNGSTTNEGRVEVYHDGEWGTVCDDDWDDGDAEVICRQLGHLQNGSKATNGSIYYAQGTGPVHLSNVGCLGNETKLENCIRGGWGNGSCDHNQDAGVVCPASFEGDVRLVGGSTSNKGRVEYLHDGQWGTVCDIGWNAVDAHVVCLQLGYKPFSGVAKRRAVFGEGSGPIHLINVACSGREVRLETCSNDEMGIEDCDHSGDAGVECILPDEGDVRVQGGEFMNRGRVEIYHDGRWGSVCASNWSDSDAWVVCQQLGYKPYRGNVISSATYGRGFGPIHLDNVGCGGRETRLDACNNDGWANYSCNDTGYAAVQCTDPQEGDVRLVNGPVPNEGRVEIYHNGKWGTVCDDAWGDIDAQVVCRQLGYQTSSAEAALTATYGQGSGPIHLDNVRCTGDEERLNYCIDNGWGYHNCDHSEDAGVICTTFDEGVVRLVDGPTTNQGRVEIFHNYFWGAICKNGFTDTEASVVCRQLGYNNSHDSGEAMDGDTYSWRSVPVHFNNLSCRGTETRLDECNSSSDLDSCSIFNLAGVRCISYLEGAVRLVGGSRPDEGRVEIFHDDQWGTVCQDGWTDVDARIVCRQLGHSGGVGRARIGVFTYGVGSGPIYLDNVNCQGTEGRLDACSHDGWGIHNCYHSEDAGVQCFIPTTAPPPVTISTISDIRLVGGSSDYEGRVEVYGNGQWGTVCSYGSVFGVAEVICRQLGYPTWKAEGVEGSLFGTGSGPIWLLRVYCSGSEENLNECTYDRFDPHSIFSAYCTHSEDVAVRCPPLPKTSPRVIGTMSFVGVSLALLTLVGVVAVWHTCSHSKTVKTTQSTDQGILLNTTSARSTTTTPTINEVTESGEVTSSFSSRQPPENAMAADSVSLPPPPSYASS